MGWHRGVRGQRGLHRHRGCTGTRGGVPAPRPYRHRGMYRAGGVLAPELDRYRGRSCTGAVPVPGDGPAPGVAWDRELSRSRTGLEPRWGQQRYRRGARASGACRDLVRVTGPLPVGWVAVRALPQLSLLPALVAMAVWAVGGYQPQQPVAVGATRGVTDSHREPREPLALGLDSRRVAVPSSSQDMKTEKDEAAATFSVRGKFGAEGAGCSAPALGSAPMAVAGSSGTPELRPLKRRPVPGKHYQCSSYGCKLAFPSMQELVDHLKVHYRPTQSLEGKTFHCPTLGCTETFPSMQDLMAHMKVHYKPNRYFKCENCLLRFRTHRSLFKHLHVCSDSASGPAPPPKPDKPVLPPTTSVPEKEPPANPQPELAVPFAAGPHFGLLPLGRDPLSVRGLEPQPRGTTRLRASPGRARGDPGAIPVLPCPPVLAGHSSNSRIVWEHTRGRYSCTQCPFSTASREEMTLHIEDHRKNPPPGRLEADMDFGVGLAPFHAKLPPEVENSLYSQL
ncbi:PREDICTED: zinc finger protein 414 [Ficedula albicollis]|uniref:zinc finger protein 414 n=1 Tax=Ficedula albicollis TaxID=59894 RepID=UPI0003594726|nr:PREDICTED: zinc finger protein 414 [Ficedula albicollis]